MRLIDADALKQEWAYIDGIPAVTERDIDDAPTIDAIPVEWMNEKFMDLQNKDKALSRAAWLVLHTWQKEQEAR